MCNYILTSFTELNDSQFNYSDYTIEGSGAIKWFHPSYAEVENSLNIITPDNYKPKDLPTMMEAKREDPKIFFFINNLPTMMEANREDPKLFFFIDNFAKALWIVDFWLEYTDTGTSSSTGDAVEDWISTCCSLLNNFRQQCMDHPSILALVQNQCRPLNPNLPHLH